MRLCGVYQLLNLSTGKIYVGASTHVKRRWSEHRYRLRDDSHQNSAVRALGRTYGYDDFEYTLLEEVVDVERLQEREQHWMDDVPKELLLNQHKRADGKGHKLPKSTKEKIGLANTGRTHSTEPKAKIGDAHRGIPKTPEANNKNRLSHLGKVPTPESRAKISAACMGRVPANKGVPHTVATKAKISAKALKGTGSPRSRLTDEDVGYIKRSIRSGVTRVALAKELGVNRCTISKAAKQY